MRSREAKIGHEYGITEQGSEVRVTLIDLFRGKRPARAQVLVRDRAIDGGRRQSSKEVVPVREVSVRKLHQ